MLCVSAGDSDKLVPVFTEQLPAVSQHWSCVLYRVEHRIWEASPTCVCVVGVGDGEWGVGDTLPQTLSHKHQHLTHVVSFFL